MMNQLHESVLWTTRPIFISSTFRDMQAERDHLRHVVFPRLEEELRKASLLLEPIDLRQGVETADLPNEESRESLVLKVCFDEINRSRPFFIALLGDRYGWVPPEERLAAAAEEAGFTTDVRDKSVTALEIEFATLKLDSEQRPRSFFYFREPLPYNQMPQNVAAMFNDDYSNDPSTRVRYARLVELKETLNTDPELSPRIRKYSTGWNSATYEVTGLKAWGELVFRDLMDELKDDLQASTRLTPQMWDDLERAELGEFVEHRRRGFTGQNRLLDDAVNFARYSGSSGADNIAKSGIVWGMCLIGDPGSGKSATFAELVTRLGADASLFLLVNAAGVTKHGSQIEAVLERFIMEMSEFLGIVSPLPEHASHADFETTFATLIARVAAERRVIVLIDALDQFEPTVRAHYLTWIRRKDWPANARLITTTLPNHPTVSLCEWDGIEPRKVPSLRISEEGGDDVSTIAHAVYSRYHRQINPAVLSLLREKRRPDGSHAAGNPLWLTLALEQLNLLDSTDFNRAEQAFTGHPAERLRAMQIDMVERMPPSVEALYDWLLAQTERIFGVPSSRAFAALIGLSRFGWRDNDLISLIPTVARILFPEQRELECDNLQLASLRRAFRAHLTRRGTQRKLDFFHSQMRDAVLQRLVPNSNQIRAVHVGIASYIESLAPDDVMREERMFHLLSAGNSLGVAEYYASFSRRSISLQGDSDRVVQEMIHFYSDSGKQEELAATQTLCDFLKSDRSEHREHMQIILSAFNEPVSDNTRTDFAYTLVHLLDVALSRAGLERDREVLLQRVQPELLNPSQQSNRSTDPMTNALVEAEAHDRLGDLMLMQGRFNEALPHLRAGCAILEAAAHNSSEDERVARSLAITTDRLCGVLYGLSAIKELEEITLSNTNTTDVPTATPLALFRLARLYQWCGRTYESLGDLDAARQAHSSSESLLREVKGEPSLQSDRFFDAAMLAHLSARIHRGSGRLAEAIHEYHRSREMLEAALNSDADNVTWWFDLVLNFCESAECLKTIGDVDAALAEARTAVALSRRHLPDKCSNRYLLERFITALTMESGILLESGQDIVLLIQTYTEAVSIGNRVAQVAGSTWLPEERNRLAQLFFRRGTVLARIGMRDKALLDFTSASQLLSKLVSDGTATPEHVTGCLSSICSFIQTACEVAEWHEVAEGAYSFLLCFNKAEEDRAEDEGEPLWADTVREFFSTMSDLNPESRDEICTVLGERAEGFKRYLRW